MQRYWILLKKIKKYNNEYNELQEKAITNAKNSIIIENAKIETAKNRPDISDSQRIKGMEEATKAEKALLDKQNAFNLGADKDPDNWVIENQNCDYIPPPSYV